MSISNINRDNITYKKVSGKAHTQENTALNEESIPSSIQLSSSIIFANAIEPLPVTNSGLTSLYSTNGIVERVKFEIDIIADTQIAVNRSQGYRLKLPSSYTASGALNYSGGTYLYSSLGKLQIVPSTYGQLKTDGTTEYDPILYQTNGSTIISKYDDIDWYLDTYNGILFVQDPPSGYDLSSLRPGYVEAYLYVGDYLDQIIDIITGATSAITGGIYVTNSKFNSYTGATTTKFNSYTGTTNSAINNRLLITTFNAYTATTNSAINNRLLTTTFNAYTATTNSAINNRLLTTTFNAYTATTNGRLTNIETNFITGATNGLTKVGGRRVTWGGTLTGHTSINGGFNLRYGNTTPLAVFSAVATSSISSTVGTLNMTLNSSYIEAKHTTGARYQGINISSSGTAGTQLLYSTDNLATFKGIRIASGTTGILITDSINSIGAKYAANYSANFDDRSLIDRGYLNSRISGITGNSIVNIKIVTGTTHTITTSDNKYNILFSNNNPVLITLTSLSSKVEFNAIKIGDGNLTFTGTSSTLNTPDSEKIIITKYAGASFIYNNTTNNWYGVGLFSTGGTSGGGLSVTIFNSYTAATATQLLNTITGATNGLTKINKKIKLGGILTGTTTIGGSSSNTIVFSGSSGFGGVRYLSNYSSNYTDRSLVDRGWVLSQISGITLSGGSTATQIKIITATTYNVGIGDNHNNLLFTSNFGVLVNLPSGTTKMDFNAIKVGNGNIQFSGTSAQLSTPNNEKTIIIQNGGASFIYNNTTNRWHGAGLFGTGSTDNFVTVNVVSASTTLNSTHEEVFVVPLSATTITLMPSPSDGKKYKIKDITGNAVTFNITINGNGKNIDGLSTAIIDSSYGAFELTFVTLRNSWFITGKVI